MKDHAEVCPLSREVMSQPLSGPLQPSLRFFRTPMPAPPTAFLTVSLPAWAAIRVFRVPRRSHEWFRFRLFTGSILSVLPQYLRSRPATFPFWVRPVSVFGLLVMTMFIGDSDSLTLPSSLAPPPHRHSQRHFGLTTSAWLAPGYIVSAAPHEAVASPACTDRLRATERPVSYRPTSAVKQRTTRLSRRTSTITPRCRRREEWMHLLPVAAA